MADIIRISDRLNPSRRSPRTGEHKAEILFLIDICLVLARAGRSAGWQ